MHTFKSPKTLSELASLVGAKIKGDPGYLITGVATLKDANAKTIAFLTNSLYHKHLLTTTAGAVILSSQFVDECSTNALITENPHAAYAKIAALCLNEANKRSAGIAANAIVASSARVSPQATIKDNVVIGEQAVVGAGTVIEAGTVVGDHAVIGENCHLYPHVTLYHGVKLGSRVVIHSGTVIGSDGFGFAHDNGKWINVPQLGSVVIHDDVDIGAHTSIDRGAIDDTIIEQGVKIDNQVQVGHNVVIGAHTVVAGCAAFAGSSKIGRYCLIGGGATFAGHITVCDYAKIAGMTTVTRSITKPDTYSSGTGMMPAALWRKSVVHFRNFDKLVKRVKALEGKDAELAETES